MAELLNREKILTVLYDVALASSGETQVRPLVTKTLQRLLYHTAMPCGLFIVHDDTVSPAADTHPFRIEAAIGCSEWVDRIGQLLPLPPSLAEGPSSRIDDRQSAAILTHNSFENSTILRLRADERCLFLLLSPENNQTALPSATVFDPVLRNFSKTYWLCRENDRKTAHLEQENRLRRKAEEALRAEHNLFVAGPTVVFRWQWAEGWPVSYVSANIEEQFGYSPNEFLSGKLDFEDIIHPDDRQFVGQTEEKTTDKGTFFELEYRIIDAQGHTRWVYDITFPERNEHGEITALNGYLIDITERKHTEEEMAIVAQAFNSREAIVITDDNNKIIRVNDAFTEITGYRADEAIGQTTALLKSGRHDDKFYADMWTALSNKGHWEGEVWNRRKNGEIYPELLHITAITNSRGQVCNYVAHFTEISELKAQQEALGRTVSEEAVLGKLLHLSLANTTQEVYLKQALDLLLNEVSWLQLVPKGAIFLVHDDTDKPMLKMYAEANLDQNIIDQCQYVAMGQCLCGTAAATKDIVFANGVDSMHTIVYEGMPDHGHYSIPLLHGEQLLGVLTLYIQAGHKRSDSDTTFLSRVATVLSLGINKRNIEQALIASKNEADEANRAKSLFLSSMSHELRTPLNAIIGFSQLLEFELVDESQRDSVHEISKAGEHLLGLINEVLDLAKIESGRIDLSIEMVKLQPVLDECNSLITPLAAERNITIHMPTISPQLAVHADRIRLKQVLLNLLSNAVKYNRPGGTVTLTINGNDESARRITVIDTGQGIDEEQLAELFEPFNRLNAEKSTIEGTGIGLVISKKLVELMAGEIGVESTAGQGSNFWFELPAMSVQTPGTSKQTDDSDEDAGQRQTASATVLYIEDNPANLRLVTQLLGRKPQIKLLTAHEPGLGLELSRAHTPDLILLDINLPGMDGFEVLEQLRNDDRTNTIPVLAVTASAMASDIEKGKLAGFDEYLTKPIDVKRFYQLVDRYLSATGQQREQHL